MSDTDAAADPTTAPAETGKVTQDFIGIPARIDAARIKTFASGTPRFQWTQSIPINDQNEKLIMQIMRHIEHDVFTGMGFLQGALDFPADDDAANYPQPAADAVVLEAVNAKGDHFFPHNFIPGGDGNVCGACELVSDHGIHSEASLEARKAKDRGARATVQTPPQTEELTNTTGSTGNDLADKLIDDAGAGNPEHVEPSTSEEAEKQEEAKAALSARSRR